MTVFQFILFLRPYETSFKRLVDDVAEEGTDSSKMTRESVKMGEYESEQKK